MPTDARKIKITPQVKIGGKGSLFFIGGPCVIESPEHAFFLAQEIKKTCQHLQIPFIFKASYDKANRSSLQSFRGPGLEKGLKILGQIKKELQVPVLSDVHEPRQLEKAAEVLDVIQIPAFLCRQTDLVVQSAKTQKPINVKKGPFLSPYEMKNVVDKILSQGNQNIILTERGYSFGYNNLVFDVRSIPVMKRSRYPVVIDASHSVQKPGGENTASGGDSDFIPSMARAGVSVGADGVFIEVHDNPPQALSDSANSLILNNLQRLLHSLIRLKKALDMDRIPE
ncbi:3-deoxy-8-phosphooctulonate synthase [bacterium]|nr:3-deoxy-8-phosphooctulonate synthase [bacterium]